MKVQNKFKVWWGWNPGKIERYLERMAANGRRLATVGFAQTVFGFTKGEPRKTRYCVDFQNRPSTEYMSMITDDGWELVNQSAGWLLWRKDYEGERPEIYTDKQSLIDRNRRLLVTLLLVSLLQQKHFSFHQYNARIADVQKMAKDVLSLFGA